MPWDEDKSAWASSAAVGNVTGSAAATYGVAEQALINSLVTQLNAALAALRDAGIIALD